MYNINFRILKSKPYRLLIYAFQKGFCTEHVSAAEISRRWEKPHGYDTGIKIYNEILREKVPFILLNKETATWYSCGPTVYADSHIGHASCYVKFDIIRRILTSMFGINVIMMMGITDIDDKIIKRAHQENCSVQEISRKYETDFFSEMDSLNVQRPSIITRVTEHIAVITSFCQKLVEKDFAYVTCEGNVYFEVKSDQGMEVESEYSTVIDPLKKDPRDFALWKAAKPNEPFWPSPWGNGRPGWHIECSAMASHIFGSKIDIHTGGYDLWFPHHSNENLQSEAYHGDEQWVNYWMHAGLLQFENDVKMSKSLGNVVTIRDFLSKYSSNVFRIMCLLSHYRNSIKYSEETLILADNTYFKLHCFLNDVQHYISGDHACQPFNSDTLYSVLCSVQENVYNDLRDDFNTSQALKHIIDLTSEVYKYLKPSANTDCSNVLILSIISSYVDKVLTLLGVDIICKQKLPVYYNRIIDAIIDFRHSVRMCALGSKVKAQNTTTSAIFPTSIQHAIDNLSKTLNLYGIQYTNRWTVSNYDHCIGNLYVYNNLTKILDILSLFQEKVLLYETHFNENKNIGVNKDILKETDHFRSSLSNAGICIQDFKQKSLWYPLDDKHCDIHSNNNK